MKQKIKNYLKLGILLFGVSLVITACQKDEPVEANRTTSESFPRGKLYSQASLPQNTVVAFNSSIQSLTGNYSRSISNSIMQEDYQTSFGTILTNEVLEIESENGIFNYTFRVVIDDNEPKTFYNLI